MRPSAKSFGFLPFHRQGAERKDNALSSPCSESERRERFVLHLRLIRYYSHWHAQSNKIVTTVDLHGVSYHLLGFLEERGTMKLRPGPGSLSIAAKAGGRVAAGRWLMRTGCGVPQRKKRTNFFPDRDLPSCCICAWRASRVTLLCARITRRYDGRSGSSREADAALT